jgi:predicted metal-dependent hydrolase
MPTMIIGDIAIQVERKRIKNMYMRVAASDGSVNIAAPLSFSDTDIQKFAASKIAWIQKRRALLASKPRPAELHYVTGEVLYLWGKPFTLRVEHGAVNKAFVEGSAVVLQVRNNTNKAGRKKIIETLYRDILKKAVPYALAKWEKTIGVKTAEWKIQNMRTKWGTCNISARRIVLNLQLVKKSSECFEYVLIHELIHLLEKSHNARFKKYMDTFCPEWRVIRKRLNERLG